MLCMTVCRIIRRVGQVGTVEMEGTALFLQNYNRDKSADERHKHLNQLFAFYDTLGSNDPIKFANEYLQHNRVLEKLNDEDVELFHDKLSSLENTTWGTETGESGLLGAFLLHIRDNKYTIYTSDILVKALESYDESIDDTFHNILALFIAMPMSDFITNYEFVHKTRKVLNKQHLNEFNRYIIDKETVMFSTVYDQSSPDYSKVLDLFKVDDALLNTKTIPMKVHLLIYNVAVYLFEHTPDVFTDTARDKWEKAIFTENAESSSEEDYDKDPTVTVDPSDVRRFKEVLSARLYDDVSGHVGRWEQFVSQSV